MITGILASFAIVGVLYFVTSLSHDRVLAAQLANSEERVQELLDDVYEAARIAGRALGESTKLRISVAQATNALHQIASCNDADPNYRLWAKQLASDTLLHIDERNAAHEAVNQLTDRLEQGEVLNPPMPTKL